MFFYRIHKSSLWRSQPLSFLCALAPCPCFRFVQLWFKIFFSISVEKGKKISSVTSLMAIIIFFYEISSSIIFCHLDSSQNNAEGEDKLSQISRGFGTDRTYSWSLSKDERRFWPFLYYLVLSWVLFLKLWSQYCGNVRILTGSRLGQLRMIRMMENVRCYGLFSK